MFSDGETEVTLPSALWGSPLSLSSISDQAGASLPNPHPGHPHPAETEVRDGPQVSSVQFSSVQFSRSVVSDSL